jgi:hypothetical protein
MFANTGIVHAVIPEQISDLYTMGVFYNCKNLETAAFEKLLVSSRALGTMYFAGCEKLKEIVIPLGLQDPFASSVTGMDNSQFEGCSSLEKVTLYVNITAVNTGVRTFAGCTKLSQINIMKVGSVEKDASGKVIGYLNVTEYGFQQLREGAFFGCASLRTFPILPGGSIAIFGNPFEGCGIEVLVLDKVNFAYAERLCAGMPNLKEIWISKTSMPALDAELFSHLTGKVNVYFFEYTRAQIVGSVGNDDCFAYAGKDVTFYFKDTMPADVVWPERFNPAI